MSSTARKLGGTAAIALILLFSLTGTCIAGWHHKVVARGQFIALTVDQDGVSHYLYQTPYGTHAGKIEHVSFNAKGKLIAKESLPSLAFATEVLGDIAADAQNHLHVVVSAIGADLPITYGFFDGSEWQIQELPDISRGCEWPTVAVDADSNPHVACYRAGPYHYSYDGTTWTSEAVPVTFGADSLAPENSRIPIFIESTGNIHIGAVVSDESSGGQNLACDNVNSSGTWTSNCGCLGSPGPQYQALTMGVDSSGYPRFMYGTGTLSDELGIAYCAFDGAAFSAETLSSTSTDGALAVSSSDVSEAVILEPASRGSEVSAVVGTLNDGTWSYQPIGKGPGLAGVGLALDSNGLPRAGATAADYNVVYAYFVPK